MSGARIVRRPDGALRVQEVSRSGRVKSDRAACEACEGTGVAPGEETLGPGAYPGTYRTALTGRIPGRVAWHPAVGWTDHGHHWDAEARGAMTCRECGMVWSETCPAECDGTMPY